MAVDLNDLIPALEAEVNPPGVNQFPNANGGDWLQLLRNAFWEARLFGLLQAYEENAAAKGGASEFGEGIVVPRSSRDDATYDDSAGGYVDGTDMNGDEQQLVVLYAAFNVTLTHFQNLNSGFRAKAGPVELEQDKSAQVLRLILEAIKEKIARVLENLSVYGGEDTSVFDAVVERSWGIAQGTTWYVTGEL